MVSEPFGLTDSQQIVWLHEMLLPGSSAYTFTATIDLEGTLDRHALRAAAAALLVRHDGLRLELVPDTFPPQQRVAPACEPDFEFVDLGDHPDAERESERLRDVLHRREWQLCRAPLVRWCLVRTAPGHHRLLHTEHHLVHDGWSFMLVLRDLFASYRELTTGEPARLPVPRSFADHARTTPAPERLGELIDRWRPRFADLPPASPFDADRSKRSVDGGQLRLEIPAATAAALRDRARADGHTPYAVLLALLAEVVRRESGQHDLVIGSAVGNRPAGFDECVGMFVNTIPLRIPVMPRRSAGALVDLVTDTLIASLEFQDVPIQLLTRALGMRSAGGADNPLFDVMFSAHDAPVPEIELPGLRVRFQEGYETGTSRFALDGVLIPENRRTLSPRPGPGGMVVVWDFSTDVFDRGGAQELAAIHLALLSAYLADPGTAMEAL